ncbi:Ppr containing protein, partial [Thalictrum thalictroides]
MSEQINNSTSTCRRRRRISSRSHLTTKPPNPSLASSSSSHRRVSLNRRLKPSKPIKVDLQRCHSEPILWTIGVVFDDDVEKSGSKFDGVLYRPYSCMDIFAPPTMSPSVTNSQRYNKDVKVVVNVTVEGSPGPVRTLVKLGASVEDTIKLVVDKYSKEGRSPQLGRDNVSFFDLHHSHFSLE